MCLPLIVNRIVDYVGRPKSEKDLQYALILLGSIAVVKISEVIFRTHESNMATKLGIRMRSSILMSMFSKAMKFSFNLDPNFNVGKLANMIDTDIERMKELPYNICSTIFLPMQLAAGFVLMYLYVQ